jgi:GNAT superfamily N-acetyltransferase
MNDIQIRVASAADLAAIIELADGLNREDAGQRDPLANLTWPREEGPAAFASALARDSARYLLAIDGDTPIGYLAGAITEPTIFRHACVAEIRALFVQAPYRGRRIGEHLIASFIDWARAKEADRLAVSAFAANAGGIRFYQRLGFVPHEIVLEQPLLPSD